MEKLPIIIVIAAVALLAIGGLIMATEEGGLLGAVYNGQEISCNPTINAKLTGKLDIVGQPVCHRIDSCIVNPAKGLSLVGWVTGTDIEGKLVVTQSGVVYASKDVTKNVLAPGSTVGITACVPAEAKAVRLSIMNEQGGFDDDIATDIQ